MESSTNDLLHEGSIKELAVHAAHFLMVVWIPKGMVENSGNMFGHHWASGNIWKPRKGFFTKIRRKKLLTSEFRNCANKRIADDLKRMKPGFWVNLW